jgi:hypothetical protein
VEIRTPLIFSGAFPPISPIVSIRRASYRSRLPFLGA